MSRKQIPIFEILVGKGFGTVSPSHYFVCREFLLKEMEDYNLYISQAGLKPAGWYFLARPDGTEEAP